MNEFTAVKMPVIYLAIAIYFLFVLAGLLRRGREISGPWWFLMRSFLPSWRFYHDVGRQPRLYFRLHIAAEQWSDWTMFVPRAEFSPLSLFHNPKNNLALLQQTLVDQLSTDIQRLADSSKAEQLVSYRLVNRLVRELLARGNATPAAYQFEIRLIEPLSPDDQTITTLISPVMPWK